MMNLDNTVKNWKWWLVLPIALIGFTCCYSLDLLSKCVRLIADLIYIVSGTDSTHPKWLKRIFDWVDE